MEENVALDTAKQKKFVKSIKGIKKLIKKNETETLDKDVSKPKDGKVKRKRPERGLVYLSHIPHGFYEHQMTQYFKQFGLVTNARVIRSKRTGNSKGYAFVEFKEPTVAEIVAETMNNYLMGKRLIKATYVPPEKQRHKVFRKHWSRFNNPGRDARLKSKKAYNENKDEAGDLKRAKKILSNLNKTKNKLSEMGINYDFFTPVDVPEALQDTLKEKENLTVKHEKEKRNIVDNKKKQVQSDDIKLKKEDKKNKKAIKEVSNNVKGKQVKQEKVKKEITVVNKKEQKQKEQKLKNAGVKPPENFIKVQEDSEESDSSIDFDSDEYEKMLEDDGSDIDSGDDSGDEVDDEDNDESEEIDDSEDEEIVPPKKAKGKGPIIALPQPKKQMNKPKPIENEKVKRKESLRGPVAPKKPKFEKQTAQPMKKQFKKK